MTPPASHPDIISRPTQKESQVHTLYNANDYIKYTSGSEKDIFSQPKLLGNFPDLPSVEMMDLLAQEAPALVRRELSLLFPEEDLSSGTLSVITLSFHTENDMSKWSEEMEDEREKLMEHSVVICKELCGRLKDDGYWSDFIDPSSGSPHFSAHTNSTLFETNETYRALGFDIDDLGCCKVILPVTVWLRSQYLDIPGDITHQVWPQCVCDDHRYKLLCGDGRHGEPRG